VPWAASTSRSEGASIIPRNLPDAPLSRTARWLFCTPAWSRHLLKALLEAEHNRLAEVEKSERHRAEEKAERDPWQRKPSGTPSRLIPGFAFADLNWFRQRA
jgi:hypothetical protein